MVDEDGRRQWRRFHQKVTVDLRPGQCVDVDTDAVGIQGGARRLAVGNGHRAAVDAIGHAHVDQGIGPSSHAARN
jgi:hypothetical protein